MTPKEARRTIAGIRLAIGIGALAAPRLTGRLFGLDPGANPSAPYLARLFGARELYMAAPVLLDPDGDHTEAMERGLMVDLADAAAVVLAGLRGYVPKRTVVLAGGAAVAAAVLGSIAARPD